MLLDKTFDERAKKNKLAVGFDLRNDFTQISFCMLNQSVPDTFSMVAGEEEFDIPTLLCRLKEQDKWLIGREALEAAHRGEGILVEDLILLAKGKTSAYLEEKEYPIETIFELFIKKCLLMVAPLGKIEDVVAIAVTLRELDDNLMQVIKKAVENIFKSEIALSFLTYEDCFFQYLIHQPQEMWMHDVLLYHYRKDGIMSYYMQMNRSVTPCVCFIEKAFHPQMKMTDMSEFSDQEKQAYLQQLDDAFLEMNHTLCDGKTLACTFLLGERFAGNWCKQSIQYLCKAGRVFQGTNLFSKGACYHAREKAAPSSLLQEYCYLSEDKLKANIGIICNDRGEDKTLTLLKAGTSWFEATADFDVILVKDNRISLVISPIDGSNYKVADITLEGFQARGNRTNRMGIHLEMTDKETMQVEIRDKGFGEFFASTGQIWRESFSVVS